MKITTYIRSSLIASSIILLTSCAGSGIPCAGDNGSVGISFNSSYTLKVNFPATITSTISPENCRNDMTFGLYNFGLTASRLPDGMSIVAGNIKGTPTQIGIYRFSISINSVENYQSYSAVAAPHSPTVTVTVTP